MSKYWGFLVKNTRENYRVACDELSTKQVFSPRDSALLGGYVGVVLAWTSSFTRSFTRAYRYVFHLLIAVFVHIYTPPITTKEWKGFNN
jgi:hypothetical protein